MEFLTHYANFLLETATLVLAIIISFAAVVAIATKNKSTSEGKLKIKKLSEHYQQLADKISEKTLSKKEFKAEKKKNKVKKNKHTKKRLFVIDFHGDIKASAVECLREEITAILLAVKPDDECLVRVESAGGMVHAYGLAASQLDRIKLANIKLTVAVDKVAASGGYLMACVADKILAAPFAIIGSIGVVTQLPNFHRFLQKKAIDFELLTAGQYKRTLTVFGENTKEGRNKMQEEINDVHELFKQFIRTHRRYVDINQVATGEYWYGTRAQDLKLIDDLMTSDDYLLTAKNDYEVFQVNYQPKKSLSKRLSQGISKVMSTVLRSNTMGGQDYLGH